MVIVITEERPDTPEARALIEELDTHLALRYARESRHGFSIEKLLREGVAFFVAREEGRAVGCAGLMLVGREYAEVKRMYVRPGARGRGLGGVIRLETGIDQGEAIALYECCGLRRRSGPIRDDPVTVKLSGGRDACTGVTVPPGAHLYRRADLVAVHRRGPNGDAPRGGAGEWAVRNPPGRADRGRRGPRPTLTPG